MTAQENRNLIGVLLFMLVWAFLGSGCSKERPAQQSSSTDLQQTQAHAHSNNDETCFICDPSKRESGRLWCGEHARYEDRCWICQPQLEEEGRLYCVEHSLYEDECHLCHPEVKNKDTGSIQPSETNKPTSLFCNEHQVPERECGICQPQMTAELEPGEELKVRFESKDSSSKAGLQMGVPEYSESVSSVKAVCEVQYDGNAHGKITPFAPGIVRTVLADVGKYVRAGDALVELHSSEIAEAKAAFSSAVVDAELKRIQYEREKSLADRGVTSEQELELVAAEKRTATLTLERNRQRLSNYGLTNEEIDSIEESDNGSASLFIRAPFDGTLIERNAVIGESVKPGDALFTLVDMSSMWLDLSIPEDSATPLQEGLDVEALFSGHVNSGLIGELTWISSSIDPRSRMVRARAIVPNKDKQLRKGMFGEALIHLKKSSPVISVPTAAVQEFENQPYVFVQHEEDLFGLRRVAVGRAIGGYRPIKAGLNPGEPVVVVGAFTAMSEFLKSRLGAGCVDD